ncbi:MAG: hypothetical protein JO168_20945 [Solirubrobacterales bacterium]|nr:hypothetical protein [Solirubrobacterales bacterium]
MELDRRIPPQLRLGAWVCAAAVAMSAAPPFAAASSGGAGLAGSLAPTRASLGPVPPIPGAHASGSWLGGATITEYWPAPEAWFTGRLVTAPGLTARHRIDWLYSAAGVSMEGEGVGLDGRMYHIGALGNGGWVTAAGRSTSAADGWAAGPPYWRAGAFWRNRLGGVTFPLAAGGWSSGTARSYVPLRGVSFAAGAAPALRFYRSVAVDPHVIPVGSRVYIPAYRNDGYGGWFTAQDTGGAITGRHIDVYRSPPASPLAGGSKLTNQRIFVVKPRG